MTNALGCRRPAYRLALAVRVVLVAIPFGVTVSHVPSGSMEPTLTVAGRHLVDRAGFRLTGLD